MLRLLFLLLTLPVGTQEPDVRPPLGLHLRQVDDLASASGVALDDSGGLWVVEQQSGRLVRVEARGRRRVLTSTLHAPLDVEVAADGSLYVSESAPWGVVHLSPQGERLGRLGGEFLGRASGLDLFEGNVFVADRRRHRIEVFDEEGLHVLGFGGHGSEPGRLIEPSDVAVDAAGNIFVADSGNSRVQVFDSAGVYLRSWGDWGPFPGLFFEPSGIEVRGDEVFVSDYGNHRVQVFSSTGKLLERFGLHAIRPREGAGYLHYPAALALSPNGEFAALAEPWVDRVQVFCRTGGTPEDEVRRQALQLAKPSAHFGMQLECSGPYLFIAEPESHSVVVYENTGDEPRRITRVSGLGSKTGLLTGVGGMHFDRERRDLWVCDPILRRLSMFRLRGSEQDEVGFDALMGPFVKSVDLRVLHELELADLLRDVPEVVDLDRDAAGRFFLADRRNGAVIVLSKDCEVLEVLGVSNLQDPTALCVTRDGARLFVLDESGALWRFDAGEPDKPWEARRIASFTAPYGVALDEEAGVLFVTDHSSHKVFRYSLEGDVEHMWGGKGLARGEFYKPRGVAVDQRGHVLVLDYGNHRLVRFDREGTYQGIFGPRLYTRLARYPNLGREEEEGE